MIIRRINIIIICCRLCDAEIFFTEYHSGAIIIVQSSQLKRLDAIQRGFLRDLGVSERDTFVSFNFASPSLRRDIELLGLLHKRVLGQCHPGLRSLLPFSEVLAGSPWHNKQLESCWQRVRSWRSLYDRSLYMNVLIYNRLPQDFVDLHSVTDLQKRLIVEAKNLARDDQHNWREVFHDCGNLVNHFTFDCLSVGSGRFSGFPFLPVSSF